MHSWKKSLRNTALAALLAFSSTTVALAAPNVTLNVHDGEVRDVLTAISALSDASIVTDESVLGKITIALDNVPFDTAIKLITSAKGLAYRVVDGVILVSTQENLNKFNGNVNVFKLNYAKAEDVKAALEGLLEGTNKVGTDPITNSILFTGSSTDKTAYALRSRQWMWLPSRSRWKPRSLPSIKMTLKIWASTGTGTRFRKTAPTTVTTPITTTMKISAALSISAPATSSVSMRL